MQKAPFTIQITSNGMGYADQELRHKLIKTYLTLLNQNDYLPSVIAFYTEGVKLLVSGSPILEELKALEGKGVRLIACGTCLNHYGLAADLQVGLQGGMTDIIEAQWQADKVITL
ncbi:MAG: DsrE family protein [Anaerolineales bacterium]|nr:DsrE family protein [Anaerolineales bacterium]